MNVGFTGAYCTANFGDYAILINNIFDINADNNIIFTYSGSFPHLALKYYCSEKKYITKEVCLKNREYKSKNLTPFECIDSVDNLDEIIMLIEKLDVLCVSGGGYFDDNWCGRTEKFIKMVVPILIAERLNKKIVFMAQGIGPIVETKEIMRYFFRYLKNPVIAVRDDYCSESFLKEVGVAEKNIHHLPDDLLFINQAFTEEKEMLVTKPYVVIVLHDSVEYIKNHTDIFVKFSNEMKALYGVSIVLLPFDLVWYGCEQSEYLSENIADCTFVDIRKDGFPTIEDVYSYIKNASLVVTGRYHASVVALQTKTPVIVKLKDIEGSIDYSYNKVYGILQKVFSGISFDENQFMSISWEDIFSKIIEKYYEIIEHQKKLLNDKIVHKNMQNMQKERQHYISENFN